eukprot:CAMPEP_0204529702 /NCGR_PEP_ID=MMETSP0661-20131031/10209_1 /ASSEMBLY_ACC=CAM_ASM_000606 /TAXON_ID=109239 /ORGANISM="Alexandrium margalefi, Strain AMGDE01CS-322" /LENGTH=273 /DNA_ID=CAMNT_0051535739 /DNA_START=67 /DNA_END=888 /DNA_ORIENTATION=+
MAIAISELETLSLSDGTTVQVSKTPGMAAEEWKETKKMLEENPEEARRWETFVKDAKAVKGWMQQQCIQEYYQSKLSAGDEAITNKIMGLDKQPEFAHIFEDVKRGGVQAALQHSYNEPLMMKVNRAVGGIPEEVKDALAKMHSNPITLQEACKMGDLKAVKDSLEAGSGKMDLEAKDSKGVTCLGYAIGANRIAVVKLLLEKKADASACDSSGGNAVHYAAAYGRKELLECLIKGGVSVNAKTTQGQTPLALATKNKQKEAIDILKGKGASM